MASVLGWTTAAIVRAQLGEQVSTQFSDAEIETIISMNEGYVSTICKIGASGEQDITFDSAKAKHLILRKWVTALTCLDLMMTSSASFTTLDQALLAAEIAAYTAEECQKYLTGEKTDKIDWLNE